MRILSYNLWHHRASGELEGLASGHDADVVCVQEAHVSDLPGRLGELELAATTTTGSLGLGVYVRADRFAVTFHRAFQLKRGLHDLFLLPGTERLLAVRLVDRRTGGRTTVASFHAAPLTATNRLRRHQVTAAHMLLDEVSDRDAVVMIGDFNYPLFRSGLERVAALDGFTASFSDAPTYRHTASLSTHFDLLTSRGMRIDAVRTLAPGASDHNPILVDAHLSAVADGPRVAAESAR
ncbi:endonuclease/exonuclease/phosphatase family protein [Labedella populi]|uniref:Endonuclease/exonuclease/phosphatase family protein n=1 Tax=Labedella populi TaxID=2498850 RepID=A0A444QBV5_9MICO|nr:endonuclease/exonuclease/phosphatase family protein [Labedella populi]RWZ61539.1 endonuclease/exonuclease/phosphatase family protein [Labedella populi]